MSKKEIVFGIHPVETALQTGQDIGKLFVQRDLNSEALRLLVQLAKSKGIPCSMVPKEKLNRITLKNHQGIVCTLSPIAYLNYEELITQIFESGETPLFFCLDKITDVRNMGAIARSAHCAGVHGLVIPSHGGAEINADAIKSSSGALLHIPVVRAGSLYQSVSYGKSAGLQVIVADEKASTSLYDLDLAVPTQIIMGSEYSGVDREITHIADAVMKIPCSGEINSLNVAVATGIIAFEARRQRNLE